MMTPNLYNQRMCFLYYRKSITIDGVLSNDLIYQSARKDSELYDSVDTVLKSWSCLETIRLTIKMKTFRNTPFYESRLCNQSRHPYIGLCGQRYQFVIEKLNYTILRLVQQASF